jgi:hypothetical protein
MKIAEQEIWTKKSYGTTEVHAAAAAKQSGLRGKRMEAMKRIAQCGFGLLLSCGLLGLPAGAQNSGSQNQGQSSAQPRSSSGSSLGDYARQVRKDPGQPKAKPRVFDNDNLPKEDKLSIVGQPAPATADNSADAKPADAGAKTSESGNAAASASSETKSAPETKSAAQSKAPAKSASDEAAEKQAAAKQWQQKITAQKEQIDLLQREIDVLQREYQIRAAAFYADAGNRLRNSGSWDKQDAQYKQQIADKLQAIEDAKQKLDDMQEEARKAGVPASMREP